MGTRYTWRAGCVLLLVVGSGVGQSIPSSKQPGHKRAASLRVVSIRFVLGGGFGCGPYCSAEIQVRPGSVTLLERPLQEWQQRNPLKYRELKVDADLSDKHWQELQKLIDHDTLFALPDRIPCHCTGDEGSETLEVTFSDHTKKAVNSTGAPKGFESLVEKLVDLHTKLRRELPPGWDK